MRKIEFKTVRHTPSLGERLSGHDFDEAFEEILSEQGQEGWDLKSVVREHGLQTLLIFSREVEDANESIKGRHD